MLANSPPVKRRLAYVGLGAGLVVVAVGATMVIQIGPRNIGGMLRYDTRREGDLRVGGRAPDVVLTALDGKTPVHLSDHFGSRPVVLIFGSFT